MVDPTDAVRAAELVQLLDQLDRAQPLAVERDRDPALEVDAELDRSWARRRGETVHS